MRGTHVRAGTQPPVDARFRRFVRRSIAFGSALGAVLFLGAPVAAAPADSDVVRISPAGMAQVAALIQEKESRTPAQRKIDSNILYEIKMQRGLNIASGVATLTTGLSVDTDGGLEVEIRADVTDALLNALAAVRAGIIDVSKPYRTVAARVPIQQLEALAGMREVYFIRPYYPANVWGAGVKVQLAPAREPSLAGDPLTDVRPSGFAQRAQRVRDYLANTLPPGNQKHLLTGSQNSQGDTTHQANTARSTIGVNGSGIKIGVISNGVVSLAASQALGDLGPVTVLPGQIGSGDEGTAMLEIVHDLAPNAQLFFATANPTIATFAQNVRDLRTAGCDIIIDDVFYFVETPFQDGQAPSIVSNTNGGVVTQAVRDVVAAGAMYFSSAGNQGNVDDNTASCYQGDFVDGGTLTGATGGTVHDFGSGAQSDLITAGSGNPINLYWSDPLGGSSNDYDLYVFNNALTVVLAASTNVQSGTQDPEEQVGSGNTTNNRVVVLRKTGAAARFFHITINANGVGKLGTAAPGTTKGHSMAAGAFSVAATPAAAPGPFPAAFSSANVSETFTSDGPRRIFFDGDGTAFTPGNFSSTGGILRQKPDITAADRVSVTGVGGFPTTFSGTSAAAPHAGAIAALLLSGLPAPTPTQVGNAMRSTAIDIEAAGTDRDTGVGIVMPLPALANLGIVAQAAIDMGSVTVAELAGSSDGDGQVEKGETGTLVIGNLVNNGPVGATGVTATLSTTTTGVSILAPTSLPYSNIAGGGGTASNATPYKFLLGPTYTCGAPVDFALTVAYNDGSARSKVFHFTVSLVVFFQATETLDATPPAASTHYTAITGTQTNRVSRDGQASTCAAPKAVFPGTIAATTPRFDAYTFTVPNSGCTVVSLTLNGTVPGGGTQIFATAYTTAFVPASIGTNYLADAGFSPGSNSTVSFSFNATAGQTYVVVVAEVPGSSPAAPYTLRVSGPALTTCDYVSPNPQADLTITKSDSRSTYTPGQTLTYVITTHNNGPTPVTGASVVDTLPASLTGATWTCVASVGSACGAPSGSGNINTTANLISGGSATYTLTATAALTAVGSISNTASIGTPAGIDDPTPGNNTATDTDTRLAGALYSVTPCRVLDTRNPNGPLGGPALSAGGARSIPVAGTCGIPASATAIAVNVAVTGSSAPGNLLAHATGTPAPNVSLINYRAGQTRADNGIIRMSAGGSIDINCNQATGTVHVILDVAGYFIE
jgi:uncharacterized repeat protein (TIGR01451 family)